MLKQLLHLLGLLFLLSACTGNDDEKEPATAPPVIYNKVELLSVSFHTSDNDTLLLEDVECSIVGDSIVECWMPDFMPDKRLVPRFEFSGEYVCIDGRQALSGQTAFDFRTPIELRVFGGQFSKRYVVYVHSFTGLPVMWIDTENHQTITSKDEYLHAHFRLLDDVSTTHATSRIIDDDVNIRGRGNSTWFMSKKPYLLKFDKDVSLLSEPFTKSWVLINNYSDKTMLRNSVAFYMSSISKLVYTPRTHFVELILNGEHNGTYLLSEKLNLDRIRDKFGFDDFLLQIDARAADDDITFHVPHIHHPIVLEDADDYVSEESLAYIKRFLNEADSVLFSDDYTDPVSGWQRYIDVPSFVDWYLINEIARNNDALFFSSCYMSLRIGGKLRMGPVWDFDIAFGNINYDDNFLPEGFWISRTPWFRRLLSDPVFMARVKQRFDYFYSRKSDIMHFIDLNAEYLTRSVQENEKIWHTLNKAVWPNYKVLGNYPDEVQELKEWLNTRLDWMKSEYDKK